MNTSNTTTQKPILRLTDLSTEFVTEDGIVSAVNGVSLSIYPKQTLAVVGESGCGKSITALSVLRLVPDPPGKIIAGQIHFDDRDLLKLSKRQMRDIRGNHIAMIFQEPMTSLNPVYTVGDQILEAIKLHQHLPRAQALNVAETALRDVGIADPRSRLSVYPHQLSGGMRQRIMIAMALACQPRLLLADEPTTALDVTIQAQILELLRKLQDEKGMAIMLITHDLGVVAENADVVAVMYAGRVVEYGSVIDIFNNPLHPYTQGLFSSMPTLGDSKHRLTTVMDLTPDHNALPAGYLFTPPDNSPNHPIEQFPILATIDQDITNPMAKFLCDTATRAPRLYEISPKHWVACWRDDHTGNTPSQTTFPDIQYRRTLTTATSN